MNKKDCFGCKYEDRYIDKNPCCECHVTDDIPTRFQFKNKIKSKLKEVNP